MKGIWFYGVFHLLYICKLWNCMVLFSVEALFAMKADSKLHKLLELCNGITEPVRRNNVP